MKVLLATNNQGKVARFKHLISYTRLPVELSTPAELNIATKEIEETGSTLIENADLKARGYAGIEIPILANDTGFYVEGEGFVHAPKRKALGENSALLSREEISSRMLTFWQHVAQKYGGRVNAAWIEAFFILYPDGKTNTAESRRDVILTDHIFGVPHPEMPVRALYISKATNKPAVTHSPEEERKEMEPVIEALTHLLTA